MKLEQLGNNEQPRLATGVSVQMIVASLAHLLPSVESFTLTRYVPRAGLEQRTSANAPDVARDAIQNLQAEYPHLFNAIEGLSAILLLAYGRNNDILAEMSLHDDSDEASDEMLVAAAELSGSFLASTIDALRPNQVLALCSRCKMHSGEMAHIPLLDFRVAPSVDNLELVKSAAKKLRLVRGAIANSGRSYHLYGLEILSEDMWISFMARALLLTPLVDVRYVAHRLLARRGVLRITSAINKPVEPSVVEFLS